MITEALRKLSEKVVRKEVSWDDNILTHNPKVMSTVDEGKGASFNEKAEHIFNQLKK